MFVTIVRYDVLEHSSKKTLSKKVISFFIIMFVARIFKQSLGARNPVGIGLSYRPARLHSLAEMIPWSRFLSSLNVSKFG
jgi:hypothetical protein